MARSDNLHTLPDNLPIPEDDGTCNHLTGLLLPSLPLRATTNTWIDLSQLEGRTIVYAYPRTGEPDRDPPDGWDLIPGALILNNGKIEKVFYPVFPPDQSAAVVIAWLEANPTT